jgi:hypothetical protein
MGKIPYFRVFLLFCYNQSYYSILKFSRLSLQWEAKVTLGILCSKPYSKHFIYRNLLWAYKAKTLKSQLLKKPTIEIFEILDLSSPNIRQK